jgi:phenylacetate-CoA ligase
MLNAFHVAQYDGKTKLEYMKRFSPHCVVAVPAYITRLAILCEELGYRPRRDFPDLRVFLIAAESYSIAWAQEMEDFWGIQFSEWYGSTQAGINHTFCCEEGVYWSDHQRGMLHNMDHRVLLEVLSRETGEPVESGEEGEAVITNLFREAFPVIRFRIDDRVRYLAHNECRCGRPFAGIEAGTVARYDDMMKLKAVNVWPEAIDSVIFAHLEIEEYQGRVFINQEGRERVEVCVELRQKCRLSQEERQNLLQHISRELRKGIGVSMQLREVGHGSLPRFEFKVRRWTDERRQGRQVVKYLEKES